MSLSTPLRKSFYARDSRRVAGDLIGCRLVHRLPGGERLVVRLVEVEAYLGDGTDPAAHSHRGPTPRNRTMFGPAGRLYAYRIYGLHTCVNVVCGPDDQAAAVLLRAGEPLEGLEAMRRLRGLEAGASPRLLARGPARLAQALGLAMVHDGHSLLRGPLTLHPPRPHAPKTAVVQGPRIGITRARDLPYRYFEGGSPWVSSFRAGGKRRARTDRAAAGSGGRSGPGADPPPG